MVRVSGRTRTRLPPPAPIACRSTLGRKYSYWSVLATNEYAGLPAWMIETSNEVPPMSVVITFFSPIAAPRNIDAVTPDTGPRSEEHTSELQSLRHLVCRLLLEKKK